MHVMCTPLYFIYVMCRLVADVHLEDVHAVATPVASSLGSGEDVTSIFRHFQPHRIAVNRHGGDHLETLCIHHIERGAGIAGSKDVAPVR